MNNISKRYSDRIDSLDDIKTLIQEVLNIYQKTSLKEYQVLEIGYEDFNVIIKTDNDNYFLKVFNNSRDDDEVETIVERIVATVEVGVPTPNIYKNPKTNNYLTVITINQSRFRLCLMQYIDGHDFFSLQEKPDDDELTQIAQIAAKVSETNYQPKFVYDSWAITSFLQEFKKKESYLKGKDLQIVREVYDEFNNFDYNALPKSFVHGDMMSTNMLKDKNNNIWLIDFSVSNYMARLIEIIIVCGDLALIVGNKEQSLKRLKLVFKTWVKLVNAIDFEIKSFEMLFKVANAINIMNTNYEIATGNTSEETIMHLDAGRFGMSLIKDLRFT
jgi:Ser/Thr protein kinase RdoA (MazF antagonist)